MLATGIKSPVGIKVAGTDLAEIDRVTGDIERAVKPVPGVTSALAERLTGGRYIDMTIDRDGGRALRPEHRRRAVGRRRRRSAARTSARRSKVCSASRSTCAIRASMRDSVEKLRELPIVDRARRADRAVRRRRNRDRRRPADAEERERAAVGLGLRRHPRPRSEVGGARHATRGRGEGQAAARLLRSRGRASSNTWSAPRPGCKSSCRSRC